jgi:plastocyanin
MRSRLLPLTFALLLSGCGATIETTFTAVGEPELTPTPAASVATTTVSVIDSSFGPDITVARGTEVVFVNDGALKHTASHGTNGQLAGESLFDLVLQPGASGSYTFDTPGSYPITCIVHPLMNMTITVE